MDPWVLDKPLKQVFPMHYQISYQQKELIANMSWFEGQTWRWTLSWVRQLLHEEQSQLDSLQNLLQESHLKRNVKDMTLWCIKDTFSVKKLISTIDSLAHQFAAVDSLVCTVWKNISLPKVEFMLWLALLWKLNTRDLLTRKGILPPMPMCVPYFHHTSRT